MQRAGRRREYSERNRERSGRTGPGLCGCHSMRLWPCSRSRSVPSNYASHMQMQRAAAAESILAHTTPTQASALDARLHSHLLAGHPITRRACWAREAFGQKRQSDTNQAQTTSEQTTHGWHNVSRGWPNLCTERKFLVMRCKD